MKKKLVDPDVKAVYRRLQVEIKKDLLFFGSCGLVVGYLFILSDHLRKTGIVHEEGWVKELFVDFMSTGAFSLVFIGLLGLASLLNILKAFGFEMTRLSATVHHVEARLLHFGSSSFSFTLGLSVIAAFQSVFTLTAGGIGLVFILVISDLIIFGALFSALLTSQAAKPFNTVAVSALMLLMAAGALVLFVVKGIHS